MRCATVTVWGICTLAGLSAGPALAGPWARAEGDTFISFQISAEETPSDLRAGLWEPETYLSLYAEVGMGYDTTIGFDIGRGETSREAVSFVRYTFSEPGDTWQYALLAGSGVRQVDDGEIEGLVRLGTSIGRGFGGGGDAWYMPLRHQGGWATLDLTATYNFALEDTVWQAEATAGFSLSDRSTAIFSVKAEDWPDADPLVSVSPSILISLGPATSLRVGARGAVMGSDAVGLSLAIWQEF